MPFLHPSLVLLGIYQLQQEYCSDEMRASSINNEKKTKKANIYQTNKQKKHTKISISVSLDIMEPRKSNTPLIRKVLRMPSSAPMIPPVGEKEKT